MKKSKDLAPWYAQGLHFKCEGLACGDCCSGRWGSGYVWVSRAEIHRLAAHLDMPLDEFTRRYVRQVGDRFSLIEKRNNDCVFYLEGKGCQVYDARPDQCRSYPFWPDVIESRESWDEEKRNCPGIGCGAACDKHSREDIERLRDLRTRGKGC